MRAVIVIDTQNRPLTLIIPLRLFPFEQLDTIEFRVDGQKAKKKLTKSESKNRFSVFTLRMAPDRKHLLPVVVERLKLLFIFGGKRASKNGKWKMAERIYLLGKCLTMFL